MIKMFPENVREYMKNSKIPIRLSFQSESGWPMIISLWYDFHDDKIFLATPQSSKVVNYLLKSPRCAFEVSNEDPPYCGVRGQAKVEINEKTGLSTLQQLLDKYLPEGRESAFGKRLLNRKMKEVAIILKPLNFFMWNFKDRMQDSINGSKKEPLCPEAS